MQRIRQVLVSAVLLLTGAAHASTANLSLTNASAQAVQTSETTWLLEKAGARNGSTVSWVIGATEQQTLANQLVLVGHVTVTNSGTGPATIGNIVVNLQRRQGNQWVTRSSDIANATDGDDAITANIHKQASSEGLATFTENAASGALQFMDATNNTVFSLVPQVLIPAGGSLALLFQASFDNSILAIPAGAQIRSETIVSFGNATANGNGAANVDINGDGTLDADEARVRSVPSRLMLTVPAVVNGNSTPTLTDTIDDIATTGTVSFTNAQFNFGATSGTVTATVAGGTDGGTITNCAHLTTSDITVSSGGSSFTTVQGLDLQTCSQVQVGSVTPCTPGTAGCAWRTNDLVTYDQFDWGSPTSSANAVLATGFPSLYGSTFTVGGINTITFTSAGDVITYLPDTGPPGILAASLVDPTSSSGGELAGEVIALRLNVDFSEADLLSSLTPLGDLTFCNTGLATLNGMTVAGFLAEAETLLGGGSGPFSLTATRSIARTVSNAFAGGTPSSFAQTSLVNGACAN